MSWSCSDRLCKLIPFRLDFTANLSTEIAYLCTKIDSAKSPPFTVLRPPQLFPITSPATQPHRLRSSWWNDGVEEVFQGAWSQRSTNTEVVASGICIFSINTLANHVGSCFCCFAFRQPSCHISTLWEVYCQSPQCLVKEYRKSIHSERPPSSCSPITWSWSTKLRDSSRLIKLRGSSNKRVRKKVLKRLPLDEFWLQQWPRHIEKLRLKRRLMSC